MKRSLFSFVPEKMHGEKCSNRPTKKRQKPQSFFWSSTKVSRRLVLINSKNKKGNDVEKKKIHKQKLFVYGKIKKRHKNYLEISCDFPSFCFSLSERSMSSTRILFGCGTLIKIIFGLSEDVFTITFP